MFDEERFRKVLKANKKTISDIAAAMGINKVTLYRKMSGESDFYREEIQKCCECLGEKNLNDIFFAPKVT